MMRYYAVCVNKTGYVVEIYGNIVMAHDACERRNEPSPVNDDGNATFVVAEVDIVLGQHIPAPLKERNFKVTYKVIQEMEVTIDIDSESGVLIEPEEILTEETAQAILEESSDFAQQAECVLQYIEITSIREVK